ncbi:MAG: hypothetical protein K2Y27_07920 [Xanthobacteraceae bacterium]|nr:hypothetical protein [Xanthobacteraceae bacterium]
MTIRERALRAIGALAGFGPLTHIGAGHERVNASLQRTMDTRPLARASDPTASHEAAARIASTISDTQQLVLDFIRSRGASGCTDLDIQRRFGDHGSTYRTRRAELTALGRVRDSGVRVTQDGSRRILWIAVEQLGR